MRESRDDLGVIRAGAWADPTTVRDAAGFPHPTRPAEGTLGTWVNGQSACAQDGTTAAGEMCFLYHFIKYSVTNVQQILLDLAIRGIVARWVPPSPAQHSG